MTAAATMDPIRIQFARLRGGRGEADLECLALCRAMRLLSGGLGGGGLRAWEQREKYLTRRAGASSGAETEAHTTRPRRLSLIHI